MGALPAMDIGHSAGPLVAGILITIYGFQRRIYLMSPAQAW